MKAKARVIFYTKHGCHLCDEARREIVRAGCGPLYTLEEVDIEADPSLRARYGWDVPVVAIDGAVVFKHRLTAEEFKRRLLKSAGA